MGPEHSFRIRPGDRWDGLTVRIVRSGTDWARAIVAVVLRRFPGGPVVATLTPVVLVDGTELRASFDMSATETEPLRLGTTYHGTVVVTIPSTVPGQDPDFGPYTLFAWTLETAHAGQTGYTGYTAEWDAATSTFLMQLNEGGSPGPGYRASSTTNLATAASGSVTFTVTTNLAYSAGARIRATSAGTGEWMEGVVSAYAGDQLTVALDLCSGSATHADWNINLAGQRGATGAIGPTGATGPTGPTGATGATGSQFRSAMGAPSNALGADNDVYLDLDNGNVYKRTSGSYVLQGVLLESVRSLAILGA